MSPDASVWEVLTSIGTLSATGVAIWLGRLSVVHERNRNTEAIQSLRSGLEAATRALKRLKELGKTQQTTEKHARARAQTKIADIVERESQALRPLLATLGPLSPEERGMTMQLWDAVSEAHAYLPSSPDDVKIVTDKISGLAEQLEAELPKG